MSDDRVDETARVVVVGAGQAGFSVCTRLRDLGHRGPITLIGEEAHPPYQRPPLSKGYLLGETTEEGLYLRPPSFYEQKTIELRLSTRAETVDRTGREVVLEGGERVGFERLVLATGSRPRLLPASMGGELNGVYYVRNLADINAMSEEFAPGKRVLIVGGGYVGLEAAAISSKLGLAVTLIEASDRILQRVASPETSAYFRALHRDRSVNIMEGVGLTALHGAEGQIHSAQLTNGTVVPVDFVIVGIGVNANVELAEASGLTVSNGIAVNARCQTSDPNILAAGDCASFPWRGMRIRLESVGNAIDQAEAAARTIMGLRGDYVAKPWFWSDQFDVKLQIAGLSSGYDTVVTREGLPSGVSYWYYSEGKLLAVDAMNDPRAYMVAKRLIEAGNSPDPALVTDPRTDLKSLLRT